jgi:hypothetical protein
MKRPMRGDMPIILTLPLHLDLGLRPRQRRRRRLAAVVLLVLGVALLVAGLWQPAKAELPEDPSTGLAIGDALTVKCPHVRGLTRAAARTRGPRCRLRLPPTQAR